MGSGAGKIKRARTATNNSKRKASRFVVNDFVLRRTHRKVFIIQDMNHRSDLGIWDYECLSPEGSCAKYMEEILVRVGDLSPEAERWRELYAQYLIDNASKEPKDVNLSSAEDPIF